MNPLSQGKQKMGQQTQPQKEEKGKKFQYSWGQWRLEDGDFIGVARAQEKQVLDEIWTQRKRGG